MPNRQPILIDSDTNNELDDQHAIAYAAFNSHKFDLVGVTVNNTPLGDGIQGQFDEAMRVLQLCKVETKIPLYKGAEQNYTEIKDNISEASYDGKDAVEFIVEQVRKHSGDLTLIPIGKLTNIALALDVAPDIEDKLRIVWLGSNYPEPGEYNLLADQESVNRVLESQARFEIVTVRYRQTTGSTAVAVKIEDIKKQMPGLGPSVEAVTGRHGGSFSCFGDYSIALFEHMSMPSRPLFDVVAVAIVKNANWGESRSIPAPTLTQSVWNERPENPREIVLWEHFDRDAIVKDLFTSFREYRLPS